MHTYPPQDFAMLLGYVCKRSEDIGIPLDQPLSAIDVHDGRLRVAVTVSDFETDLCEAEITRGAVYMTIVEALEPYISKDDFEVQVFVPKLVSEENFVKIAMRETLYEYIDQLPWKDPTKLRARVEFAIQWFDTKSSGTNPLSIMESVLYPPDSYLPLVDFQVVMTELVVHEPQIDSRCQFYKVLHRVVREQKATLHQTFDLYDRVFRRA